ncbi:hypothetical protein LBM341_03408 (plasmid) [Ralstonia solanacearum]|nr:hypothetical protein LBM341_03408 [Ralstonia solanacearum]NKA16302.1 hypothetical protein [Ralstonia solanacearum]NKA51312.1 hypothetical protein [Ralstonia solanacearum]
MFGCEAEFCLHRNKHGQKGAIEFFSDINRYTSLELPYVAKGGRLAKPRDSVQNSRKRGQSKEGSQRWMNP